MPIRWRLTLWFSLILCGILVLSGVVLHYTLRTSLINAVDTNPVCPNVGTFPTHAL